MVMAGGILLVIWLGFLVPQYAAWKNKCYRTVAVCLSVLAVSIAAFAGMMCYGDFINALWYGVKNSHTTEANEFVLCVLAFVWVVGHFFCWWYIYWRKSFDYIHLKGYTADDLKQILSPECKKLMGLNNK